MDCPEFESRQGMANDIYGIYPIYMAEDHGIIVTTMDEWDHCNILKTIIIVLKTIIIIIKTNITIQKFRILSKYSFKSIIDNALIIGHY